MLPDGLSRVAGVHEAERWLAWAALEHDVRPLAEAARASAHPNERDRPRLERTPARRVAVRGVAVKGVVVRGVAVKGWHRCAFRLGRGDVRPHCDFSSD